MASDCSSKETLRFGCGQPGHQKAQCPRQRANVVWGTGGNDPDPQLAALVAGAFSSSSVACPFPIAPDDEYDYVAMVQETTHRKDSAKFEEVGDEEGGEEEP